MTRRRKAGRQTRAAGRRIKRPILCLIASIAITLAAGTLLPDGYAPLDLYEFDLLVQTLTEKDTYSPKIVLVTIGDDEYADDFGRKSPLRPARVRQFIDAILTFQPRVVGVDLITDHWPDSWRDFDNSNNGGASVIGRPPTRIIWAATTEDASVSSSATRPLQCFAMPRYERDPDGTIRKQVLSVDGPGKSLAPSFALAVSRSARGESCTPAEAGQKGQRDDRIRFTGSHHLFRRFAAAKVLADASETEVASGPSPLKEELEGAIVLLGGTFEEARDSYKTPIGTRAGVEILAHAVESIDDPIKEWDEWKVAGFEHFCHRHDRHRRTRLDKNAWRAAVARDGRGTARARPRRELLRLPVPGQRHRGRGLVPRHPDWPFAEDWLGDQLEN